MSWKLLQLKVIVSETESNPDMDGTLSGTNILLLEFRPNVLARDASNGGVTVSSHWSQPTHLLI